MNKENPFNHKRVEKVLFSLYKPEASDKRRTRSYMRRMARHIEHAYTIGRRDGAAGKPLIPWEPSQIPTDSPLTLDMCHMAHVAYCSGYREGAR